MKRMHNGRIDWTGCVIDTVKRETPGTDFALFYSEVYDRRERFILGESYGSSSFLCHGAFNVEMNEAYDRVRNSINA